LTACAEALRRRWGAPCELLTGTGLARQVFAGREDIVGEIQVLSSRRTPYPLAPAQWRLVRHLRRRGPSPVYLFEDKPDVTAKLEWLLERAGLQEQDLVGSQQVPRGDLEHFQAYGMRLAGTTPPAWRSH